MALRRALFNAPAGLFIVKIVATTPVLPFLLIETQGSRLSLSAFVDLLFRYRKRVFCRNICQVGSVWVDWMEVVEWEEVR